MDDAIGRNELGARLPASALLRLPVRQALLFQLDEEAGCRRRAHWAGGGVGGMGRYSVWLEWKGLTMLRNERVAADACISLRSQTASSAVGLQSMSRRKNQREVKTFIINSQVGRFGQRVARMRAR